MLSAIAPGHVCPHLIQVHVRPFTVSEPGMARAPSGLIAINVRRMVDKRLHFIIESASLQIVQSSWSAGLLFVLLFVSSVLTRFIAEIIQPRVP